MFAVLKAHGEFLPSTRHIKSPCHPVPERKHKAKICIDMPFFIAVMNLVLSGDDEKVLERRPIGELNVRMAVISRQLKQETQDAGIKDSHYEELRCAPVIWSYRQTTMFSWAKCWIAIAYRNSRRAATNDFTDYDF